MFFGISRTSDLWEHGTSLGLGVLAPKARRHLESLGEILSEIALLKFSSELIFCDYCTNPLRQVIKSFESKKAATSEIRLRSLGCAVLRGLLLVVDGITGPER